MRINNASIGAAIEKIFNLCYGRNKAGGFCPRITLCEAWEAARPYARLGKTLWRMGIRLRAQADGNGAPLNAATAF